MSTLGIFVKQPRAGFAKTRLAATIGAEPAARLAAAFVADVVGRFRRVADRRLLAVTPATEESIGYFRRLGGGDYDVWCQPDASFGVRLSAFFDTHLSDDDSVVVVGADSPTLPFDYVTHAFELLQDGDSVLGPATDGGCYLIGLRGPVRGLVEGADWGTPRVLEQIVSRLRKKGRSLRVLPPWYDVETWEDLAFLQAHLAALQHAGFEAVAAETRRVLAESAKDTSGHAAIPRL